MGIKKNIFLLAAVAIIHAVGVSSAVSGEAVADLVVKAAPPAVMADTPFVAARGFKKLQGDEPDADAPEIADASSSSSSDSSSSSSGAAEEQDAEAKGSSSSDEGVTTNGGGGGSTNSSNTTTTTTTTQAPAGKIEVAALFIGFNYEPSQSDAERVRTAFMSHNSITDPDAVELVGVLTTAQFNARVPTSRSFAQQSDEWFVEFRLVGDKAKSAGATAATESGYADLVASFTSSGISGMSANTPTLKKELITDPKTVKSGAPTASSVAAALVVLCAVAMANAL